MLSTSRPLSAAANLSRWLASAAVALTFALASPAVAHGKQVLIVLSESGGPYQEVVKSIGASLAPVAKDVLLLSTTAALLGEAQMRDSDLVVAIGTAAAHRVTALASATPILLTLIPLQTWDTLKLKLPAVKSRSAVCLDQPAERLLRLIQIALPKRNRIGLVLSGDSSRLLDPLQRAASGLGFAVTWEAIESQSQLLPALQRVLAESDVLLTLPDPEVLNRDTAQAILLTSYRHHEPVIGYSQAYVSAGALAAVHTTPAQIGRQTAEIISEWLMSGKLPAWQSPKYFEVSVNYHVARSLGIDLPAEMELLEKLKRAEDAR